ncbi:hypothetical protein psyc5s11_12610 [Clostridium gelidum]|uniref:Uncharacterized protein n=1 Tax=Clostridium gelidum TaxID=704125 RepID=A0ABM7SZW8_9CLOT|nr:hypothetical protein [Clostridium gelidum]BCZ45194.1 hypothetical protein psyc5s11_12610 [Clostridium gelidum]
MKKIGQAITSVLITRDGKIIFKAGDAFEKGKLFIIEDNQVNIIQEALYVGCSRNKKIYAIAYKDCIRTYYGSAV